jgi:hypothetical protein
MTENYENEQTTKSALIARELESAINSPALLAEHALINGTKVCLVNCFICY